jgi:hypothetical protein
MNARACVEVMEEITTYLIHQDSNPESSGLQSGHNVYYMIYFPT